MGNARPQGDPVAVSFQVFLTVYWKLTIEDPGKKKPSGGKLLTRKYHKHSGLETSFEVTITERPITASALTFVQSL